MSRTIMGDAPKCAWIWLGMALAAALPAAAQDGDKPMPIYFGTEIGDKGTPTVKFVLSDPDRPGAYAPLMAFSIRPKGNDCNVARTEDLEIAAEYRRTPLFDPATEDGSMPASALPVFFATAVTAELHRTGLARTQAESLPYHTCTRLFWEHMLAPG